jgi:uridine phosphorylase
MTELFHLGVTSSMVPTSIVLIDSDLICDASSFDGWRPLSIRREYVNGLIDGVLICAGAYGSPAAVIALEELVRAGARQCVTLSRCHCVRCLSENYHRPVIATGAVRDERISNDYAPRDFPAVPSHELDAVDLVTSALFVVSSAIGIRTASVVLSAIADTDEIAKTVTAAIRALQTMERSTNN